MQIFYLSNKLTITLFFILWLIFQVSAALISLAIPNKYFTVNGFLFKDRKWEKGGQIYDSLFKVRKWKRYLPDGGAVTKKGFRKKHLTDHSKENLERFVIESCRAELTHLLAILPFWVFGFFAPPIVILLMFIYALAVNLPCMIAQRYNRPRFLRILKNQ